MAERLGEDHRAHAWRVAPALLLVICRITGEPLANLLAHPVEHLSPLLLSPLATRFRELMLTIPELEARSAEEPNDATNFYGSLGGEIPMRVGGGHRTVEVDPPGG